jgi:hypothetical protein
MFCIKYVQNVILLSNAWLRFKNLRTKHFLFFFRSSILKIKIFAFVFFVILAGLFYATPYLTLYQIERAYNNNQMADVIQHIDVVSIKAQLKNELTQLSTAAISNNETTPDESEKQEMLLALANTAIDHLTPENMSQALGMIKLIEQQLNIPSSTRNYFKNAFHSSVSYQGFNTVSVVFYSTEFISISLPIVLKRNGLFSWKITGFKLLPKDKFLEKKLKDYKDEWMKKQQAQSDFNSNSISDSTENSSIYDNYTNNAQTNTPSTNNQLAALNAQMGAELALAKSRAPYKNNIIEQEHTAWQHKLEACPDIACMSNAYQQRISELKQHR